MTESDKVSELACLLIMLHGTAATGAALRLSAARRADGDESGRAFWDAVAETILRLLGAMS